MCCLNVGEPGVWREHIIGLVILHLQKETIQDETWLNYLSKLGDSLTRKTWRVNPDIRSKNLWHWWRFTCSNNKKHIPGTTEVYTASALRFWNMTLIPHQALRDDANHRKWSNILLSAANVNSATVERYCKAIFLAGYLSISFLVRRMQIWVVVMVVEINVSWLPGFALQILQQNHVQNVNSLGIKTWENMENAGSKPENHNDPFQARNRIKPKIISQRRRWVNLRLLE